MTSPNLESVAADSNVLLSAIAGKAALRVFGAPVIVNAKAFFVNAEAFFINSSTANGIWLVLIYKR